MKKAVETKGLASLVFPAKVRSYQERRVLENLQRAPRKYVPPPPCSPLVPLTSPTLPLSIFLLPCETDPHSWEGLG